ncbi:hypothetical protein BDZ89DRAFT_1086914 [Hymenopellis radicata]|nr:hypothetical protein BDZ89DRAFT_1086914 [Hymenopellis radicata]
MEYTTLCVSRPVKQGGRRHVPRTLDYHLLLLYLTASPVVVVNVCLRAGILYAGMVIRWRASRSCNHVTQVVSALTGEAYFYRQDLESKLDRHRAILSIRRIDLVEVCG